MRSKTMALLWNSAKTLDKLNKLEQPELKVQFKCYSLNKHLFINISLW